MANTIYDFVIEEEAGFKKPIHLSDGWWWNFRDHVRRSYLLKNTQFTRKNENREFRPFKNIIRPILNIQYRTEGFDVKDIEIFVNNAKNYFKSFLVRKFHFIWALENAVDTFIDDMVESYVDYGGVLVKNVDEVTPEVVDLRTIAFCDQTNFLSGPFAIKDFFSPNELRDMIKSGWGETSNGATISIEDLIIKSEKSKQQEKDEAISDTPGKNAEIYEVHGTFPDSYLKDDRTEDSKYTSQIHIIAFYQDDQGNSVGVTLFAKREPKLPFKFLVRDKVRGRALGFGGIEELFEAQTWTNFGEIIMIEMLRIASKVLFKTDDPKFKSKNNVNSAESGEIFDIQPGRDFGQIDTTPRNIVVFENAVEKWDKHARTMGAASDLALNEQPSSGTPFVSVEAQLIEGKSLHLWRMGKIATFTDEIWRDWVIPHLKKEIVKEQEFLGELSGDEMMQVANSLVRNKVNDFVKEQILNGELPDPNEVEFKRETIREDFFSRGNRQFIKILKDEFKEDRLDVFTNIAGKQKNLALLTDKLVNVLRQFIATPEIRQDPEMVKLLNVILESSGMSPMMFAGASPVQAQQQQTARGGTGPLKDLAQAGQQAVKV